jgi:hypothetical protein
MLCFKELMMKRVYQVSTLILLSLIMASCSESKVSQCSKLIDIANRAVSGVRAVSENPKPDSIESMNKIADVANSAKTEMEAISLSDAKLKSFQTRFVAMYTDTNKATRALVTAAQNKNAQEAQQAFNSLQSATSQESPLVNEVNSYCEAQPAASPVSPAASPTLSPTLSPTQSPTQ